MKDLKVVLGKKRPEMRKIKRSCKSDKNRGEWGREADLCLTLKLLRSHVIQKSA